MSKDKAMKVTRPGLSLMVAIAALGLAAALPARANETDQYTLPDKELVDLGPYLSDVHYRVLDRVVKRANKRIDLAQKNTLKGERDQQLARLRSGAYLADEVRLEFGPGFFDMNDLEQVLKSGRNKKRFPDRLLAYKPADWIYTYTHLPIDPRKLVLLFPSSTIKVYGVYMGTDKIGHFHDLGHIYYKEYLLRRRGRDQDEALRGIVRTFSKGVISEGGVIGNMATGVFSNADLAANYVGMKFFMNLTEPVKLKGKTVPPMVVRAGEHWRLAQHVTPRSDFFAPFVSDHFNEALNPCVYEWGIRGPIEKRIESESEKILRTYADQAGRPRTPEAFDKLVDELWEYYGEDYGHSRGKDNLTRLSKHLFTERAERLAKEFREKRATEDAKKARAAAAPPRGYPSGRAQ